MNITEVIQEDRELELNQMDLQQGSDQEPSGLLAENSTASKDKMDIETKDDKGSRKKSSNSAKNKQKQRNQRFKMAALPVFEEKPKLSREELKNLRAIQLIEKMEQQSRQKEENARKKVKLNHDNVVNQLSKEKSAASETDQLADTKSTMMSSPSKEQMVEESTVVIEKPTSQKKVENRSLSKFLNPKIDLQNYSNLPSFLQNYQSQQLELRAKSSSSLLQESQPTPKKLESSNSKAQGIIFEVKENFFADQKSSVKAVTNKFAEYLQRKKSEGSYNNPLELLQGFKH